MDPITLILTALSAGAVASAQTTAAEAVKDAYHGLKTLLQRKFTDKPSASVALVEHEQNPQVWEAPLRQAISQERVYQDQAIIEAAQKLMAQIHPQQAAMGKYNVQIVGNIQGYAQGDYQQVTMNFDNEPKGK
jgi:hypothetical protein